MNKIEKLIDELCPLGVKNFKLNEIAEFTNNGIDKKLKENEVEVGLLNFKDVFSLSKIESKDISATTTVPNDKKENVLIKKNDVYITPSSEVKNEIGMSTVIAEDIPNTVYSYHIARIRIKDFDQVNPYFLSYLFCSSSIRNQINENSQGMTRYGLTKPKWENLIFPVPPLKIQNVIVNIIDEFNQLELELKEFLKSERESRLSQYLFFQNEMMNYGGKEYKLGELCTSFSGNFVKKTLQDDSFPYPVYNGGTTPTGFYSEYNSEKNSIAISARGAGRGFVNWIPIRFYAGNSCHVINTKTEILLNKYLYYFLKCKETQLKELGKTGSIPALNLEPLLDFKINVPSIERQKYVIEKLDSYTLALNELAQFLPKEIDTRRKQYEYYRDKLLTFKELESA